MRVVETRDDAVAFEVNHARLRPARMLALIQRDDFPVFDDQTTRFGMRRIERGNLAVMNDEISEIGFHF